MRITVQTNTTRPTDHDPGGSKREAVLGETVSVRVPGQLAGIEVLSHPVDRAPVITEAQPWATILASGVGWHHLRFTNTDGKKGEIRLLVCEPEALAALPDGEQPKGGVADRRMILRSLANNAPWFTGRREDLHNQRLQDFGG